MNNGEAGNLPGGRIESSQLYQIKAGEGGKQLGVTDIRGEWHDFKRGESIEFHRVEGVSDRIPMIKTADGKTMPFETWAALEK